MNGRLNGGAVTLSEISIFPWSLVNLKDGAFFFFFLFLSFRFVSFRRESYLFIHLFLSKLHPVSRVHSISFQIQRPVELSAIAALLTRKR